MQQGWRGRDRCPNRPQRLETTRPGFKSFPGIPGVNASRQNDARPGGPGEHQRAEARLATVGTMPSRRVNLDRNPCDPLENLLH